MDDRNKWTQGFHWMKDIIKDNEDKKRSKRECSNYLEYIKRASKKWKSVPYRLDHHRITQRPPAPLKLKRLEIGVAPGKKLVGMGGIVKEVVDGGFDVKSPGIRVAE